MRSYKRKLILNKAQRERLDSWISACRFVYNLALEVRIEAWKNKQITVHKYDLINQITDIRTYDWIGDVPRISLDDAVFRLVFAYKCFFNGAGFPRWANKRSYQSITFRTGKGNNLKVSERILSIPKMGDLKMFNDSPISGNIKTVVIKKELDGYYASITTDAIKDIQNRDESQVVGLDMGIAIFCTGSNGLSIENPRHFKRYERLLRIANRSLSRKKKGSNSWHRQKKRLSILYNKTAKVRMDFLHKESTTIAKSFNTVYLEDLKVSNLAKNRFLSRSILDCGWYTFRQMLSYKTRVVAINPKFTSQTCNECGERDSNSRISQSQFICTSCGVESNADENAAKNILSKGIALTRERKATA